MSALKAAQGAVRPSQRATHDALQLRVRVVASCDIAMPGVALSRCVCAVHPIVMHKSAIN